jgi:hypothetical protein
MTNENLQQPVIDAEQARAILENLQRWIEVAPFRRVVIELAGDGKWRASLVTCVEESSAGGVSMRDALAQIATVAAVEVES